MYIYINGSLRRVGKEGMGKSEIDKGENGQRRECVKILCVPRGKIML